MWLDMTFTINGLQIISVWQVSERSNIQTPNGSFTEVINRAGLFKYFL